MFAALRNSRSMATRGAQIVQQRGYASDMKFTFAAGNQVFYDNVEINQVDVPTFSGSFGILPKHVPTLAVLKPGVVSVIESGGSIKKIFVSSGTVAVHEDSSVQLLAEEAHVVESLDLNACREVLQSAQAELSQATTDNARAKAQIAVEVAEALQKAAE